MEHRIYSEMPWHYEQHREEALDKIRARGSTQNTLMASAKMETMEDKLISFGHTNKCFMGTLRGNPKVKDIPEHNRGH